MLFVLYVFGFVLVCVYLFFFFICSTCCVAKPFVAGLCLFAKRFVCLLFICVFETRVIAKRFVAKRVFVICFVYETGFIVWRGGL
jgi:hypothetical protein